MTLEDRLKAKARELGFALVGIAPATEADGFGRYQEWLGKGFAGEMDYLRRDAEPRRHPQQVQPRVRSVVMVAWDYGHVSSPARSVSEDSAFRESESSLTLRAGEAQIHGKIARYAAGPDYHDVLRALLKKLRFWLRQQVPMLFSRWVVDTAPLLERDFARRAGLGWFGKNTMLINKEIGSYFVLGALLTDLDLAADEPHAGSHCGTCTACLDACPTQAFPAPGWLDARRCVSYLTIELKGDIPADLRPSVGDWLFGCDVCQEVCPWNRHATALPLVLAVDDLPTLTEEQFQARFAGTAIPRTGRAGLARNAAVVLANARRPK